MMNRRRVKRIPYARDVDPENRPSPVAQLKVSLKNVNQRDVGLQEANRPSLKLNQIGKWERV